MGKKYLLGLDNGGTVVKAGLYDVSGNAAAYASAGVNTILGKEGAVERDMDELWEANAAVIRECVEKSDAEPADIIAVAVCGHGNGLYLVGEDGRPVRNGVYSSDTRPKDYVRRYVNDGVYARIQPKTMQMIYAGQITPLMAYFADNEPKVMEKAKWAFSCADYIRFRLTNEAWGEVTNMSVASAVNQYTRDYDEEIFEAMGIKAFMRLMPPVRQSCDVCGCVSEEAAKATGLAEGTPVAGGLFDATACAIATGITDTSRLCVVAGTWSINEFISEKPVVSPDLFLTSAYCMDGYYMVTEGSMTSASNLEWFVRRLMDGEENVYDKANAMAASVLPEDSSVVFLPFLYGTNVNPDAKACFLGLSGWHEKRHMIRAVYEGVAFSHLSHIEKLLSYRDAPKSVRVAGGVTRSDVWMQMFADVFQLPVEVSDITELGTSGAAMCAGVAAGEFSSFPEAAKAFVRVSGVYTPDASKKDIYMRKYALYKKVLGSLEPVWNDWIHA